MIIVSDKKTGEIIEVDETKVTNWKTIYNHRNWHEFEPPRPISELSTQELETLSKDNILQEEVMTLEEAREAYKVSNNKPVSNRYKNNLEWILSRI